MPYEYDKAKTAVQDPAAKPAPNGQYVMDAVDWNKVNDGVAGLADFVNGLETTVNSKANAGDIPDTENFILKEDLASAADAADAGGTLVGVYYAGAASTAQASIAALEVAVGSNTTALADKADKDEIPSVEGLQTAEQVQTAIGAAVEPLAAQASVDALSAEVEGKADAADIPDVSGFQTEAQVSAAITTATADLAAQASVDALETAVAGKADTSELVGYVQTSFLESSYTNTTNMTAAIDASQTLILDTLSDANDGSSGASIVGVRYQNDGSTVQAAIDGLEARLAALEGA